MPELNFGGSGAGDFGKVILYSYKKVESRFYLHKGHAQHLFLDAPVLTPDVPPDVTLGLRSILGAIDPLLISSWGRRWFGGTGPGCFSTVPLPSEQGMKDFVFVY